MIYAYMRVSTDKQDLENQHYEILQYCDKNDLKVDKWIKATASSRKSKQVRKLDDLDKLQPGDLLVVSELSRIGRSVPEVSLIITDLAARSVGFVAIRQNLKIEDAELDMTSKIIIYTFSMVAELERDFVSRRTKDALAARKAAGQKLGRPKGSLGNSKLDGKKIVIEELLAKKVPKASIAKIVECHPNTLAKFIKSRKIRIPRKG